jgi:4-hydroxymandelate synthase
MPRSPGNRIAFDFLELWVRDLASAAHILLTQFGFEREETLSHLRAGEEAASFISGGVIVVVREGRSATSPIAKHVAKHGDGVGEIALVCDDVASIAERAFACGLKTSVEGESASIDILGDGTILHTVRPRSAAAVSKSGAPRGLIPMRGADHVTYCLPYGTIERVARAYREVFALEDADMEQVGDIGDDDSGMRSKVLRSPGGFTVVLTEPMSATGWGQTQHFLRGHNGAGIQHVAIAYDDLVTAVHSLRSLGVPFLPVPIEHLERSHERLRDRPLPWSVLRREGILVDADRTGLLFQLFTCPVMPDGGFFFEFIQRAGATGFGAANVRGLFAALDVAMSRDRIKEGV